MDKGKSIHILVDIGHPGDVHVFASPIQRWQENGHSVTIVASDKDVALGLLDAYGLPYTVVGVRRPGLLRLVALVITRTLRIMQVARRVKPDIFISIGSPTAALASKVFRKPHVAFYDSEFSGEQYRVFAPFTDAVCTPRAFLKDLGAKQRRYDGYKELAYLHPEVFTPDPEVLHSLGLSPEEPFFVVRFVSWMATHDIGEHGFSEEGKQAVLNELQARGRVFLSVEGEAPVDLSRPDEPIPVEAFLHILAFARMYIGEGLTVGTEAALLGIPTVLISTLEAGNFFELRDRYGLLEFFAEEQDALAQIREWLENDNLRQEWKEKQIRMLAEVVNVSRWITDFVQDFVVNRDHMEQFEKRA